MQDWRAQPLVTLQGIKPFSFVCRQLNRHLLSPTDEQSARLQRQCLCSSTWAGDRDLSRMPFLPPPMVPQGKAPHQGQAWGCRVALSSGTFSQPLLWARHGNRGRQEPPGGTGLLPLDMASPPNTGCRNRPLSAHLGTSPCAGPELCLPALSQGPHEREDWVSSLTSCGEASPSLWSE